MAISDRESKVLWGKAAGRCSMPDCKKELTLKKELADGIILFGEMCHIVGEKNSFDSPRGLNDISLEDRNKYNNLILLCSNHHTIIDKDEENYTIEKLHEIKENHEKWVEENLQGKSNPLTEFYSMVINSMEKHLMFNRWNHFSVHALRALIHSDFIDALDDINYMKLKIYWPDDTDATFKIAVTNVLDSYINLIVHFLKYSHFSNGCYRPDKQYKKSNNPEEHEFQSKRLDLWARLNYFYLLDYTVKLNEYLSVIRNNIDRYYLIKFGHFEIEDELGTFNRGESIMFIPTKDFAKKGISDLKSKIKKFEKEYKTVY